MGQGVFAGLARLSRVTTLCFGAAYCAAGLGAMIVEAEAQVAASSGSRVVRDPQTGRVRVINPELRAPSLYERSADYAPIVLKKPKPVRKTKVAAPKRDSASSAPSLASSYADPAFTPATATAPQQVQPQRAEIQKAKPQPVQQIAKAVQPPAPKELAKPAPVKASETIPFSLNAAAKPESPARQAVSTKNVRNIHINFIEGAAEPEPAVVSALQTLASSLGSEMTSNSQRLLLQAFAGAPGDKSSEARRLSLKRALSVRQVLIDSGVPSERIDVRAMGGTTDGGTADRVDVIIKA